MDFEKYFDKVYSDFDKWVAVPVILFLLSVGVLGFNYAIQGQIVKKGLDFTGGTEVQFHVDGDFRTQDIKQLFASNGFPGSEAVRQSTQNETALVVRVPPPPLNETQAQNIMENGGYSVSVESIRSISAAVSGQFFQQAVLAFVMAFTIMSLTIFIAFRDAVPSGAVIAAALGDITFALAGMSLLGIPLTLGSLAALLMLIGYSVDTDILLSTRVLKRSRKPLKKRVWGSVKTGVTMSSGGIAGFTILYIVSMMIVGPSDLSDIAAVMVMGLLADMPFTWFGNAVVLKKYVNGELNFEVFNR
ncbi:MAG: protein translocase subunit SecF [Candidatus Nanohaloarchaea archaeon]